MMKFNLAIAVAILASAVIGCYGYKEASFKTEILLRKLNFDRLYEIVQIKPVGLRCWTMESEVREMIKEVDSQARVEMLNMVAEILRKQSATSFASVIANLELCAGPKSDRIFATLPAEARQMSMSNLDLSGVVAAVGTLLGDEKCLAVEDELRKQLGNFYSTDLLNEVTSYVYRKGTTLPHSSVVYNMLVECLGYNLRSV